ncbi:MAG: hypothetical protein JWP74_427 [Marmoricola sp.]|nr:hypothetical protein [Marmoricola sp.]
MTSHSRSLAKVLAAVAASTALLVAPAMAAAPSAQHVAAAHNFTVKKGHTVTIKLDTATDGGFGWVITQGKHSAKFTVVSKKVVAPKQHGNPPIVGGDSTTVYKLRMTETGNATFKAVERRSFDKKAVIDRFTLHLHITKP